MEWNPTETVTIGGVFIGLISAFIWMVRNMGQRTDPQLIEVIKQAMDGFTEVKDIIQEMATGTNKAFVLLGESIRVGNESSMAVINRVELSEKNATALSNQTVASLVSFQELVKHDHKTSLEATSAIVPTLQPTIQALTDQQAATEKTNKGMQTIMEGVAKTQNTTNEQILAALRRIEKSLSEFKKDSADKIEKIEQDVNAIKADIVKKTTQETPAVKIAPAPGAQPILSAIPTPIEKKEEPNESA